MSILRPPLRFPTFKDIDRDIAAAQMSSRRTELSLHRTRMSADRTLMSIIRTALSLIGFGFTIFQFFRYLRQSGGAAQLPVTAARNFGLALVVLGIAMLALGIWSHISFMLKLRAWRHELAEAQVIVAQDTFPLSTTLVIAAALMAIGVAAFVDMILRYSGTK